MSATFNRYTVSFTSDGVGVQANFNGVYPPALRIDTPQQMRRFEAMIREVRSMWDAMESGHGDRCSKCGFDEIRHGLTINHAFAS